MKRDTKQQREQIVNRTLFYIYKHLDTQITLDEIAKINSVSKFHFHRIFKEETNKTLFETITSIRLQKAANLLIVNQYSTISEILKKCGYSSHSSFIKAFKTRFHVTPKKWRNGEYKKFSEKNIKNFPSNKKIENLEPIIKKCPSMKCIYKRHKGYNKDITKTWQKLEVISYELNLENSRQIGLHHDNPTITPLNEASYVACLEVPKEFNEDISILEIPSMLCAIFNLKGAYGDTLNLIRYVYHYWLPNSGYEATAIPCFTIYHKNHFIDDLNEIDLDLYVPITLGY